MMEQQSLGAKANPELLILRTAARHQYLYGTDGT